MPNEHDDQQWSVPASERGASRRSLLKGVALGGLAAGLNGLGFAMDPALALAAGAANGPYTPTDRFFNAHHAPLGAYATFTLGFPGANGGFGTESGKPPQQNVLVGVQSNGRSTALPFFDAAVETGIAAIPQDAVQRDFRAASDSFTTSGLRFTLYSPVRGLVDPTPGNPAFEPKRSGPLTRIRPAASDPLEQALLPAVFAELTVDNTGGSVEKVAFFAVRGGAASVLGIALPGVAFGSGVVRSAIVTTDTTAIAFTAATATAAMAGVTGNGDVGGLAIAVPAGARRTIRFALCFYHAGTVTTGRDTGYWYTRFYSSLEAVASEATVGLSQRIRKCIADNMLVDPSHLSTNQKFMLAHAIRSYFGNTALLADSSGQPWWMVMEGQYQYMNTFDLTVDQLFFELGMNPWTVRNELENFADHYSYQSGVELAAGATGPGGVSFTHDMGKWPGFSPDGQSNYEKPNVNGTFSFMTGEQLTNWILIAGVYVEQTDDYAWFENNVDRFEAVLDSLVNRDDPTASARDGIESANSTKTGTGAEITTYDSVGPGLTEAVGNSYLGGKTWAAYVILEKLLGQAGRSSAAQTAASQAEKAAVTLLAHVTPAGYFASNVYNGETIPIIPVIEGLVYPFFAGRTDALQTSGRYGTFIEAMQRHIDIVIGTGVCITADGGWKLDSESNNTWLSKTYLNEFVGRHVLRQDLAASTARADATAVSWLTNAASARFAWSDQIISGTARQSQYYPRGVTSILWLQE